MSTDNKRELLIAEIPRLRRYAIALLRDRTAADDLVQDVVLRALDRLHLWRDGTNMRTWLFTIMHNLHANDMRRLSRATDTQPLDAADGKYPHAAWLNPLPQDRWRYFPSAGMVSELFEGRMFGLTLDGLDAAMRGLSH